MAMGRDVMDKLEQIPMLNNDEKTVVKRILLKLWFDHSSMGFKEMLQYHGDEPNEPTEEWLEDVITDLTQKVGITPEETW